MARLAIISGMPNSNNYGKLSYGTESLLLNLAASYISSSTSTDKSNLYDP